MNVMNISDIQTLCVVGLLRSLLQIINDPPFDKSVIFCSYRYRQEFFDSLQ